MPDNKADVDFRSAITGRFVKEGYAETHKRTTVKETRRNTRKSMSGRSMNSRRK